MASLLKSGHNGPRYFSTLAHLWNVNQKDITLPSRPRHPRIFAAFRVTFLMPRVSITWYIKMHHLKTLFCAASWLFRATWCSFTTCLNEHHVARKGHDVTQKMSSRGAFQSTTRGKSTLRFETNLKLVYSLSIRMRFWEKHTCTTRMRNLRLKGIGFIWWGGGILSGFCSIS